MRERPILFSAPMVRAILEGRKTQTRRIVTGLRGFGRVTEFGASDTAGYDWHFRNRGMRWNDLRNDRLMQTCPYGQPGDRLWVREAYFGNHYLHPNEPSNERELHYRADGMPDFEGDEHEIRWRPSIHMPRWASRITLEVSGVRVERLQAISGADAVAEGVRSGFSVNGIAQSEFADLWSSINGAASWYDNPWVWVIEFQRVPQPVAGGED